MACGSRSHAHPSGGRHQRLAPSRPASLICGFSCRARAPAQIARTAAQETVIANPPNTKGRRDPLRVRLPFWFSRAWICRTLRRRLHSLLGAARDRILLFEAIDASGGVHQLLAAREERVARGADFHTHVALVGGARLEGVGARAGDINFVVSGVNSSLHVVTRGSFRELQYTRNSNPRAPFDTRGLNSLGDA